MNSFKKILILVVLFIGSHSYADKHIVLSQVNLEYSAFQLMAKRILTIAYKKIGKNIEFEELPAERSLVNANNGFADGELARIGGLEEKYQNLIRINTPIAYDEIFVYSKEFNFNVEGWHSLEPYKIGYIAGFKIAEQRTKGMNAETVTSEDQGLKKLNMDRSDVFLGLRGTQCLVNELKLSEISSLKQPLGKIRMYHYLNKRHAAMAEKLEMVLTQMYQTGEMGLIQMQSQQDFLNQCSRTSMQSLSKYN